MKIIFLLWLEFSLFFAGARAGLCNQSIGHNLNISTSHPLPIKFDGIKIVNEIIVLGHNNHVKEFKIEFSDEDDIFRNIKNEFGLTKIFLVSDLKNSFKVNFTTPIIAKV